MGWGSFRQPHRRRGSRGARLSQEATAQENPVFGGDLASKPPCPAHRLAPSPLGHRVLEGPSSNALSRLSPRPPWPHRNRTPGSREGWAAYLTPTSWQKQRCHLCCRTPPGSHRQGTPLAARCHDLQPSPKGSTSRSGRAAGPHPAASRFCGPDSAASPEDVLMQWVRLSFPCLPPAWENLVLPTPPPCLQRSQGA